MRDPSAEKGGTPREHPRSKWWAVACVPELVVLVAVGGILRGLVNGLTIAQAVVSGLLFIAAFAIACGGMALWMRYGDSEGEGDYPEIQPGITRWTRR